MTAKERIHAAMRAGSEAGKAGGSRLDNPYDPRSTDRVERLCFTLWTRLFARHDPFPVDFTDG